MELSGMLSGILPILMICLVVLIIGTIIIFGIVKYRDYKRYDILCFIIERASGGIPIIDKDIGGVFVDGKTNNKRFFLKTNGVGLDPDNIPYIMNSKGQKVVYLLRFGLKNFKYINIKLPSEDTYLIQVGEEDVNWAVNAYEKYKKVFGTSLLDKLLPYIGIAIVGMITLGIIYVLVQKFEILQGTATALEHAAQAIAQASSGTAIIE